MDDDLIHTEHENTERIERTVQTDNKEIDYFSDYFTVSLVITRSSPPKTLSVSEFKTHCTDALREVETTGIPLQITRHGRPVAIVCKPGDDSITQSKAKSLRDWMGSLAGTIEFANDYDPAEPAFSPQDWEDHPANRTEP